MLKSLDPAFLCLFPTTPPPSPLPAAAAAAAAASPSPPPPPRPAFHPSPDRRPLPPRQAVTAARPRPLQHPFLHRRAGAVPRPPPHTDAARSRWTCRHTESDRDGDGSREEADRPVPLGRLDHLTVGCRVDDLRHAVSKSVTLGDEEARKRKVQKTILERKGPPTFNCAIEVISKAECRVHHKLESTVDAILAGKSPLVEVRKMDTKADDSRNTIPVPEKLIQEEILMSSTMDGNSKNGHLEDGRFDSREYSKKDTIGSASRNLPVRVYMYKILEADLLLVAKVMGFENDIDVTDDIGTADAILASSSELKQNPWIRSVAKYHQLSVFVIKSNTMAQMVKAVRMILQMNSFGWKSNEPEKYTQEDIEIDDDAPKRKPSLEEIDALEEVRLAIEYIVIPGGEAVELLPRCSEIIARQLELVESYQLAAEKSGTELNSRLQILPHKLEKSSSVKGRSQPSRKGGPNSLSSGNRLPLLPE